MIDQLPTDRVCRGSEFRDALRRSWKCVSPTTPQRAIGVGDPNDTTFPAWARGNLQRIEPIEWRPQGADGDSASLTLDHPRYPAITAWRAPVGHAAGSQLSFTFPAAVRLARVLVSNGIGVRSSEKRFRDHGRIALASLRTDGGTFYMLLPDRPEFYELRCDFGVTQHATLTVNSVYAANTKAAKARPDYSIAKLLRPPDRNSIGSSNVAVSSIQFWGTGTTSGLPQAASRVLAATRPQYMPNGSYRAICPSPNQDAGERTITAADGSRIPLSFTATQWQQVLAAVSESTTSSAASSTQDYGGR